MFFIYEILFFYNYFKNKNRELVRMTQKLPFGYLMDFIPTSS